MTSASTLPATGVAPIGVRRPPVPTNIGAQRAEADPSSVVNVARTLVEASSETTGVSGVSSQQTNLGGASSIALQVVEASERTESSRSSTAEADLSEEEQRQVEELKARDREVRTHEQAHAAVGAPYTSAPSYEFVRGPDGVQYAVAGQVQIDSAPIPDDPEATIQKLEVVQRAALAPAEPSSQDRAVAAQAAQGLAEARAELQSRRAAERSGELEEGEESSGASLSINATEESEEEENGFNPTPINSTSFGPTSSVGASGVSGSAAQIINLFA
ncbi:putative metalloprotease CJM1_0395 family protein [Kordiimonas laminariae]|uniref:putative metalloprotease CJM1_0395 family protein n=1 Tax=Kordiimonas laminariae TaxID=2917717 RepID=UPI001FF47772|nr:putative metalloprotease CJM1_0395 family protein [Kordiimonas laminariae]MCK0070102.1 hypothetical protein [Kordiimonas laminariae]